MWFVLRFAIGSGWFINVCDEYVSLSTKDGVSAAAHAFRPATHRRSRVPLRHYGFAHFAQTQQLNSFLDHFVF